MANGSTGEQTAGSSEFSGLRPGDRVHDQPAHDRRASPRELTRLFVRALGGDREFLEVLGDLSIGGVGFELPHAPDSEEYVVRFSCPGEAVLRMARAHVIRADPSHARGGENDGHYAVHLRFTHVAPEDEVALARAFQSIQAVDDVEIVVADPMETARTGTA